MDNFIECQDCGFVLLAEGEAEAIPKRVSSCPSCDGTEFTFTGT